VVGEQGKCSGGRRVAPSESQPKRNVPPPSRRRKPATLRPVRECLLVTSVRFAEWTGRGRRENGADRQSDREIRVSQCTAMAKMGGFFKHPISLSLCEFENVIR